MGQLFIVRHAKAEASQASRPDFDRALTAKGRQDAFKLGAYLKAQKLAPQKILVSSAKRTLETFLQLNLSLENSAHEERRDVYNAGFDELRALIAATGKATESLMIIGHNPGMHALALFFSKPGEEPQDFPPASLLALNFDAPWNNLRRHGGHRLALRIPQNI